MASHTEVRRRGHRHPALLTAALHGHPPVRKDVECQTGRFAQLARDGPKPRPPALSTRLSSCSASHVQSVSSKYTLVLINVIFIS